MAKSEEQVKDEYRKHLDPKEFHKFKLDSLSYEKPNNMYDFFFQCLYEYFSTANFKSDSRLLELGSGPTIHNIASACAFVPYIVLSEFVEANCEELRRWLRKDPGHFDWTPFIKHVAKAEGRKDTEVACQEIENRIRSAVRNVVHCDVLDDQMVPPAVRKEPYDVVMSCLTFETAATTKESLSAILGRVRKLLKSKGKLVLIGVINCSIWKVGTNSFHYLPLLPEDIKQALEDNNYGDIKLCLRERQTREDLFDGSQVYFLTCTKS